jgi:uncharacterized protein YjdB
MEAGNRRITMKTKSNKYTAMILTFVMLCTVIGLMPMHPSIASGAAPSNLYATGFDDYVTNPIYLQNKPLAPSDYDVFPSLPASAQSMAPLTWYKGGTFLDNNSILQPLSASKIFVKESSSGFYRSPYVSLKFPKTTASAATISVSTATYQNISVSYYAKKNGSSSTFNLFSEWSVDGGTTWNLAHTLTGSSPELTSSFATSQAVTFTLVDQRADDNPLFLFRLRADKTNADYMNVDDLTISGDPIASVPVTSIQLNKSAATLALNDTLQLSVQSVLPANATGRTVKWESSDPSIATVNYYTGLVQPLAPGTTTIRATNIATGAYAEAVVQILNQIAYIPVTSLSLNPSSKILSVGMSFPLNASVLPEQASNTNVNWSSSDPTVASVDSTGLVTANQLGTASITATSEDNTVFSSISQITVVSEPEAVRSIISFGFVAPSPDQTPVQEGVSPIAPRTIPVATGTIDQHTKTITVKVPAGTDVTKLVAAYTTVGTNVYVGTAQQTSGVTRNDFSNPITYKVSGLSRDTTDYTVIVHQRASNTSNRTFYASTADDVVTSSKQALPGDTIVMKDGIWLDADIYFSGDGTATNPITLRAETQGKTILQGASRITVSGSYLVVDGMTFTGISANKLDGALKLDPLTYNCRLTNTIIDNFNPTDTNSYIKNDLDPAGVSLGKHHWIWNYGTYNRIDHNTMIRKSFTGETLRLYKGVVHHALIDHNYFAERKLDDNNGTEAIQVGMYRTGAAWDAVDSFTTIEYNLFEHWMGEIETVSIKASNTIFRYNTIRESRGTIALRISDNSQIYGNFFMQNGLQNAGGIRVYGANHKIYNNYITGTNGGTNDQRVGIALQAGVSVPGLDTQPARNTLVAFNTIVGTQSYGVTIGAAPDASKTVAPDGVILINNILKDTKNQLVLSKLAPTNLTSVGNIVYGTTVGLPSGIGTGFLVVDPLMVKSVSEEVYRPSANSAAIGAAAAIAESNFIHEDMDGQTREALKDIGADQFSTAMITRRPLTSTDVGPVAPSPTNNTTTPSEASFGVTIPTGPFIATSIFRSETLPEAKPNGDGTQTIGITIPKADNAKGYEIILPISALMQSTSTTKLAITTEIATFVLPADMLKGAAILDTSSVSIILTKPDLTELPTSLQNTLKGQPVFDIHLKIGEKLINWSSNETTVEVSVPYPTEKEDNRDPEHTVVWYIDSSGKTEIMPTTKYNPVTGVVTFKTNHFSLYAVTEVYKTFDDLSNFQWAQKQIEVLASKGILEGTTDRTFQPANKITRADFLLLLVRTLGLKAAFQDNYNDVSPNDYFYEAVGISKALGITEGIGNNLLNPHQAISRQDMMVILNRTLTSQKLISHPDSLPELASYKDVSTIAAYAQESVRSLIHAGIIEGDGNSIRPLHEVTRAEAAVVMYRINKQQP